MNLININRELNTEEKCLAYLEAQRWPHKVRCLLCGNDEIYRFKRTGKTGKVQHLFQCKEKTCCYQFSATTSTIFHRSHLPLTKWFIAISIVLSAKKGVSARQIMRNIGVSYKTAWYLCHRIREAMTDVQEEKLGGVVEVDETYIGGRYDRRSKRGPWEKPAVVGLIQRGGRVEAMTIPTPSKAVLCGVVRDRVSTDAEMLVTDQYRSYHSLKKDYRHKIINHLREYVKGRIHTNSIENFWSLLKRGIVGNFHHVSLKHLPRYLVEATYKFNNRKAGNLFQTTVRNLLAGETLPYRKLVGMA